MRSYLEEIKRDLQSDYDTVPETPSYDRTRELRRGWRVIVRSNNFGDLINDKRYAYLVQGPLGQQRRDHRRRGWRSITEVARIHRPRFAPIVNRVIGPRRLTDEE